MKKLIIGAPSGTYLCIHGGSREISSFFLCPSTHGRQRTGTQRRTSEGKIMFTMYSGSLFDHLFEILYFLVPVAGSATPQVR